VVIRRTVRHVGARESFNEIRIGRRGALAHHQRLDVNVEVVERHARQNRGFRQSDEGRGRRNDDDVSALSERERSVTQQRAQRIERSDRERRGPHSSSLASGALESDQ